jgi:GTP cyclohydrolase II
VKKKPRIRVRKMAEARLPTRFGTFRIMGFEHGRRDWVVALVRGLPARAGTKVPLVRIHSQCLTGDVFGSVRCDCRAQLEQAMKAVARNGVGAILYEPQEGRGIGLINKLRAYGLQDRGMDTVEANRRLGLPADRRNYSVAAAALQQLKLTRIRLLSNNPAKVAALERAGIRVLARVPCQPPAPRGSRLYLRVKKQKLGHFLNL